MKRCYLALRSSFMGLGVSLHFMTSGYCARSNSIVRSQNMQPQNLYTSYNFTLLCIHIMLLIYIMAQSSNLKYTFKPVLKGLPFFSLTPCLIFSELAIFLSSDQTVPIFLHRNTYVVFNTTVEGFRLILQQLTLPSDVPSVNT